MLQRHVQRGGDFDANVEHLQFGKHPQFVNARVKAAMVGQFHDEITLAFPFVERVDVDDVRVVEPRARARLAEKTFQRLRVDSSSTFINFTATIRSSVVSQAR